MRFLSTYFIQEYLLCIEKNEEDDFKIKTSTTRIMMNAIIHSNMAHSSCLHVHYYPRRTIISDFALTESFESLPYKILFSNLCSDNGNV